jgi:ABC-2 type transport system permease protein
MVVITSVVTERQQGTLAMQILAPSPFSITYLVRGIAWVIVGTGSSTGGFIIAAVAFRLPVSMPQALLTPVVLAIVGLGSYCFGLALGALVMSYPGLIWLFINVGYLSVMTICGVNVPVTYWPRPVQAIANLLPVTHGLAAFRLLLAGGSYASAAVDLAVEIGVAAGWLCVAIGMLSITVRKARRNGTLELSDG